jgi:hypothetical protein
MRLFLNQQQNATDNRPATCLIAEGALLILKS